MKTLSLNPSPASSFVSGRAGVGVGEGKRSDAGAGRPYLQNGDRGSIIELRFEEENDDG
jgi:hypothetical protein